MSLTGPYRKLKNRRRVHRVLPFLWYAATKQSPSNRDQGLRKIYEHESLAALLKPCPDMRYKRGLLKTMFDRAYRLLSCCSYFSEECYRLRAPFSRLGDIRNNL